MRPGVTGAQRRGASRRAPQRSFAQHRPISSALIHPISTKRPCGTVTSRMLARRCGRPRAGVSGADASLRVLARRGRGRWRARRRLGFNDVPRMSSSRAHHKLRFHNSSCAKPQNGDHAIWVVTVMCAMQKRAATPLKLSSPAPLPCPTFTSLVEAFWRDLGFLPLYSRPKLPTLGRF